MIKKLSNSNQSSSEMTGNQSDIYLVEAFLEENYQFRRNLLSGKTEFAVVSEDNDQALTWNVFTKEDLNTIVRNAKKLGLGGNGSPRQDIEEYIGSKAVLDYDPIKYYLDHLPGWDGKNHVAALFSRIPGITSEQLGWCATWLRSAVAHWLHLDTLHGNEVTPILIGQQRATSPIVSCQRS